MTEPRIHPTIVVRDAYVCLMMSVSSLLVALYPSVVIPMMPVLIFFLHVVPS